MQRKCIRLTMLAAAVMMPVLAHASEPQKMPWPSLARSHTNNHAGSTKEATAFVQQAGNSFLNRYLNSTSGPAWLSRTDIAYDLQAKNTPVTSIETIQPLYESNVSTIFWQGRFAYNSGDGTGNLGFGYRYLTENKQWLFGANAFYDVTVQYAHTRVGIGGELFTPYVVLRANYYDALSGNQNVNTSVIGTTSYEHALSGYDVSLETPIPYISWMRLTAAGYHWQGIDTKNINGGEAGIRSFPARQLEMDLGIAGDNQYGGQAYLRLNYYLSSPAFIQNSATTPSYQGAFAPLDLEQQRLQKVIRHNDVVVEKTSRNAAGVIIGRGT